MRSIPVSHRTALRSGLLILAAVAATLLTACTNVRTNDHPTSDAAAPGFVPGEVVTTQGHAAESLYLPVFIVAVAVFILVEGLVLFVSLRFRRRAKDTELPKQTHGNNKLEVLWTAIPFVIVLTMFVGAYGVLNTVEARSTSPDVVWEIGRAHV